MNRKQRRMAKGQDRNEGLFPPIQSLFDQAMQHHQAGRLAEAEPLYRQVLAIEPRHADSLHLLGVIAHQAGRLDIALDLIGQSIALKPHYAVGHSLHNLGQSLQKQGKFDDAATCFLRVLAIKPDHIESLDGLCTVLMMQTNFSEAEQYHRRLLALKPDDLKTLNNLGGILRRYDRFEEATVCLQRALALKPDYIDALNNMGSVLKGQGRGNEGIAYYRRALAAGPSALTYSNMLMTMIYMAEVSPQELTNIASDFGRNIADPLLRQRPLALHKPSDRKLRIGYVSPDFRAHPVNYFLEPMLKLHDRRQFEIFAYSNNHLDDLVTAKLKKEFDHWRDIRHLNDDQAADLIESDAIDILVDLAGHTAHNRLLVFARKPAPVQVTWLGFPATTGMKAMDYRITDIYAEPEGMTEHLNVETLWRLPEIFCCYGAHESNPAVIGHPPFEDNSHITFGCFNNFAKVTDPVLAAWAKIMANVPDSCLLLEISGLESPEFRGEVEERLKRLGLPLDRVILEPRKGSNQFILYNKIDIALDPFPCVGGTTSMDTLWMGVPLVTLEGKHFVSRMGVTFLTNVGMPELIAHSVDEYVRLAVDLALDRERLRGLRHNLRQRVERSPLMNQTMFARNMEAAFREMWQRWCVENGQEKPAQSRQ